MEAKNLDVDKENELLLADLMEEVYFVVSYSELIKQLKDYEEKNISSLLVDLLEKNFIQQMQFDENYNDYIQLQVPDTMRVEDYYYLATKKGLLQHTT